MHWLEKWLFPPTCVITGAPTEQFDLQQTFIDKWQISTESCPRCAESSPHGQICGLCLNSPPAFNRTQVAFKFDTELRDLIHQFKYAQHLHLSRLLAEQLADSLDSQGVEALIPIPLHTSRLRERGYNQALELARIISKQLNIPILHGLKRQHATPSQTKLNAKQRRQNLKQAFVADARLLNGLKHIALVDDVITTGATMQSATNVLQTHQPGLVVQAWAVAKTQ